MTFTLAHFSDLHLGPLPRGAPLQNFRPKRLLGAISWHYSRKKIYRPEIAEALLNDVRAAATDHVAFTGDAANLGSPAEFPHIRRWLDRLATPDGLSYTPGNHDVYVKVAHEKSLKFFEPFMTSDMPSDAAFPFVRLRRNVALIGLNSALPRPFHNAQGQLGLGQRERLRQKLAELRGKGFYRVVMLHHPPAPGLATKFRNLIDAEELQSILCQQQAELVIYGHNHSRALHWLKQDGANVPALGVASASMAQTPRNSAEWNTYEITRVGGQWHTQVKIRRWNGELNIFEPATSFTLEQTA